MSKRGVYRKRGERIENAPSAWEIGDQRSFAAARARAMEGVCLDTGLTGNEKAVLGRCFGHMNHSEQWSCFASIATLAKEAGVHPATCWRAICKADGVHIRTKRSPRIRGSQYSATHITIHENYIASLRRSSDVGANVAPTLGN